MLETLRRLGPVDVCIVSPAPFDDMRQAATIEGLDPAHALPVPLPELPKPRIDVASWSKSPFWNPWARFDFAAARRTIESAVGNGGYDVTWAYSAMGAELLDGWGAGVRLIDLPELPDVMDARHGGLGSTRDGLVGAVMGLRWRAIGEMRAIAWRRIHDRAFRHATHVVVCSEVDRPKVHFAGSVLVVQNGFRIPKEPVGPARPERPARTLMFQGTMVGPANHEAAAFFAHKILPRIREQLPDAVFRIVGRPGPEVLALEGLPGVEVAGGVEHIEDELVKADAIVVPLRIGSGTRVKILEAWSHALPVVSTSVGAEGLPAADGENALIADSVAELTAACVRILTDAPLRERLAAAGRNTAEASLAWEGIQDGFAAQMRVALGA